VGGGDAEVDAIGAVVDVEERRRRNRGRQGRNGSVDAEVDVVKPPEHRGVAGFAISSNASGTKARVDVANTERTRRGPQPCGCAGQRSNAGEDTSASRSQRRRR